MTSVPNSIQREWETLFPLNRRYLSLLVDVFPSWLDRFHSGGICDEELAKAFITASVEPMTPDTAFTVYLNAGEIAAAQALLDEFGGDVTVGAHIV